MEEDLIDDGRVRVCFLGVYVSNRDQILSISVYWETNNIPRVPFGKRATMFAGPAPLKEIFLEEVSGQHVKSQQVEVEWDAKTLKEKKVESGGLALTGRQGKMLVPGKIVLQLFLLSLIIKVSCAESMRDELRLLVRDYVRDGVSLLELDYQPC